jgi:hypothetical protein
MRPIVPHPNICLEMCHHLRSSPSRWPAFEALAPARSAHRPAAFVPQGTTIGLLHMLPSLLHPSLEWALPTAPRCTAWPPPSSLAPPWAAYNHCPTAPGRPPSRCEGAFFLFFNFVSNLTKCGWNLTMLD